MGRSKYEVEGEEVVRNGVAIETKRGASERNLRGSECQRQIFQRSNGPNNGINRVEACDGEEERDNRYTKRGGRP